MSVSPIELESFYNDLLTPQNFNDYCPNGIQIEGKKDIKRIAFAVSATKESISKACHHQADCLIVHHGLFWKFHGSKPITGPFAKRVIPLIKNEINLLGYHLPLDAHLEFGNAACIAQKLKMHELKAFGDYKGALIGIAGKLKNPTLPTALQKILEIILDHNVILSTDNLADPITSLGIITGGANSYWPQAKELGLDAFLTGEMSEHDWHEAKEAGISMFAGGHNATEKFGIQALMQKTQQNFDVEVLFIPSENPA